MVQWLRLHSPNAGGQDSIPGQGIRSHTPQLKISRADTKTEQSQINKYFSKKKLSQQQITSEATFILKSLTTEFKSWETLKGKGEEGGRG